MVQRVHNPKHWRFCVEEAQSIADQMNDPECKRLLVSVAMSYAELARRAEAREAARGNKSRTSM